MPRPSTGRAGLVALALVLSASAAPLTAVAETVSIRASGRWKTGDTVEYERVKTRIDSKGGTQTARGPVTLRVVVAQETRRVVSWRHGRTTLEGAPAAAGEAIEAVQQAADGLELVFDLDHNGEIRSLRNWEEVRDRTLAATDKVLAAAAGGASGAASGPGMDDAALQRTRTQLRAMFAERRAVESVLAREPVLFHAFYGWDLDRGKPETWEDQLPNPLGGASLPARATLRLVGTKGDTATFRYTLVFDRAASGKILADSLAAMASRLGAAQQPDQLRTIAATLDIRDEAELVLDTRTRWPVRFSHERKMKVGDRSRTDRLVYERR